MSTLTITVDDEILRKAELRARQEGSSVDAVMRKLLDSYAGVCGDQLTALQNILELAENSKAGHVGKRWTRDELYDRRVLRQR
jgi:hypothetical protein